jgi:cytochrome c553
MTTKSNIVGGSRRAGDCANRFDAPRWRGWLRISKLSGPEHSPEQGSETTTKSISMKNLIPLLVAAAALSLSSARAADVKELYEKSCVKCHGADGKGETKMGKKVGVKDLTDAKIQGEFTDEQAFKTIKEGKKDKEDKVLMKPIEGATDDEIKALVAHVRSLKK